MKISKELAQSYIKKLGLKKAPFSPDDGKFAKLSVETFKEKSSSSAGLKTPKLSEDGKPIFRMLSSTIVQRVYDFTEVDFTKYVDKFSNVKLMRDHDYSIDSILGRVGEAFYDGDSEVPGVNAPIDIVEEFDTAMLGKKVKAGLIDSGSVGIRFETRPSHEFEDEWDFYWLLGTKVDGELVRFIVTEITAIQEFSLVWEGADPYAKAMSANVIDEVEDKNLQLSMQVEELQKQFEAVKAEKDKAKEIEEETNRQLKEYKILGSTDEIKSKLKNFDIMIAQLRSDIVAEMVACGQETATLQKVVETLGDCQMLIGMRDEYRKMKLDKFPNGRVSVNASSDIKLDGVKSLVLNPVIKKGVA